MKKFFWLALSLTVLSGCQLTRVEGTLDDIDIRASTSGGHHHSRGGFCPPGQAKKGAC